MPGQGLARWSLLMVSVAVGRSELQGLGNVALERTGETYFVGKCNLEGISFAATVL